MRRSLQLASLGLPNVAPNPMVGCVIVFENQIIGEGSHKKYGGAHAEVEAIRSVKNTDLLKNSTLYVTLEPCSHTGKTPPCADLIIANHIPNVVCAMYDPNPMVAGRGIQKLRNAGIDVKMNVLEIEAEKLNKTFVTYHRQKRPYIILKWARTSDGFMGRLPKDNQLSKKISDKLADVFVHKLRAESGGILIGSHTAMLDNPSLTTRLWPGRNPVRIVLDSSSSIPTSSNLFSDENRTVVFGKHREAPKNVKFVELNEDQNMITSVLAWCHQNGINQLLVEGGLTTLQKFIDSNMWDEAYEIVSPQKWEVGIPSPRLDHIVNNYKLGKDTVFQHLLKTQ